MENWNIPELEAWNARLDADGDEEAVEECYVGVSWKVNRDLERWIPDWVCNVEHSRDSRDVEGPWWDLEGSAPLELEPMRFLVDLRYYSRWPMVRTYEKRRLKIVEYDLYYVGEEMTDEAVDQLEDFAYAYYAAHEHRLKTRVWVMQHRGAIPVLPEHADEFAARVLLFITELANLDPRHHQGTVKWDAVMVKAGYFDQPKEVRDRERRDKIEANYPDLVADPLDQIPGAKPEH